MNLLVVARLVCSRANQKDIQINFKGKAEYEQLIAFRLANAVNADIGASNLHIVRVGRTVYAGDDQLLTLETILKPRQYSLTAQCTEFRKVLVNGIMSLMNDLQRGCRLR